MTLQAKAENTSEREAQRGDGDGACNCPISREAVLRLESVRVFQVHCNHPSEMIPGLDTSWEWIGKPQAFKAYVRFAAGSQQDRGKCHVGAQPAVYRRGERAAGSSAVSVELSPENSRQGLPDSKIIGAWDEKQGV